MGPPEPIQISHDGHARAIPQGQAPGVPRGRDPFDRSRAILTPKFRRSPSAR
jgi:hypothetical protein